MGWHVIGSAVNFAACYRLQQITAMYLEHDGNGVASRSSVYTISREQSANRSLYDCAIAITYKRSSCEVAAGQTSHMHAVKSAGPG